MVPAIYARLPLYNVKSLRVPAEQVAHIFTKQRVTQVRGISLLSSSIDSIQDIGDYLEAERVKARISACFAMTVATTPQGIAGRMATMPEDYKKHRRDYMEPGMIEYLLPGESMNVASPSGINTNSRRTCRRTGQRTRGAGGSPGDGTARGVDMATASATGAAAVARTRSRRRSRGARARRPTTRAPSSGTHNPGAGGPSRGRGGGPAAQGGGYKAQPELGGGREQRSAQRLGATVTGALAPAELR